VKIAPAALYTLVGVLGATAGFLTYRHYLAAQPKIVAVRPSAPAAQAAAAPDATQSPPARPIPEDVPDLAMVDLAGTRHGLRAIPGRTHLFNFWASWCEPCRREIPLLNTLQSEGHSEGLSIVGIAVDTRTNVVDFLKATPLHYTVLVGEEDGAEAAEKFGMELGLPFTVFADSRNRIVAIKLGELHRDEADAILAQMRNLEAGKVSLESARDAISEALRALGAERSKQSAKT
jgi:thiol-disulfide isomerase/thioredoxin